MRHVNTPTAEAPSGGSPITQIPSDDSVSASRLDRLGDATGGVARFALMWATVIALSSVVSWFASQHLEDEARLAFFGIASNYPLATGLVLLCVAVAVLVKRVDRVRVSLGVGLALVTVLSLGHGYYNALYLISQEGITVRPTWNSVMALVLPLLIIAPFRVTLAFILIPTFGTSLMTGLDLVFEVIRDQPHEVGDVLARLFLVQSPTAVCALISLVGASRLRALSHKMVDAENVLDATKKKLEEVGTYKLERKLGQGGMGEVWRATHAVLARPAAIKLVNMADLAAKYGASVDMMHVGARFEREAKVTARLTSPHTVRVYDYGTTASGALYYAMELLEGVDIDQLVELEGKLSVERAASVLLQACDSLAEAHARGLVHRDIKPANLFICKQGLRQDYVKVLDFGLAGVRESEKGPEEPKLTREGTISGTPHFMAPEQAMDAGSVDGKADVYALGCVGYTMLTGQPPFDAPTLMAIVVKHLGETPESPSAVRGEPIDERVEALIMRMLSKRPEDRPSAHEVAVELFAMGYMPWTDSPLPALPPSQEASSDDQPVTPTLLYVEPSSGN
jgi:serine/threonine protein kinase